MLTLSGLQRGVGVDEAGDKFSQGVSKLVFIAAHQDGIFKRILTGLADFEQIFTHHLVFLEAGDDFACRTAPDDVGNFAAHVLDLGQGDAVLALVLAATVLVGGFTYVIFVSFEE
jgi:hypothetical protein